MYIADSIVQDVEYEDTLSANKQTVYGYNFNNAAVTPTSAGTFDANKTFSGIQPLDSNVEQEEFSEKVIAGPFHPAFRQQVESGLWYDAIVNKIFIGIKSSFSSVSVIYKMSEEKRKCSKLSTFIFKF